MKEGHDITPVPTTGAEGSESGPLQKPLDKAPHDYIATEYTPEDNFHEEGFDLPLENEGSFAKRFS